MFIESADFRIDFPALHNRICLFNRPDHYYYSLSLVAAAAAGVERKGIEAV